jgi:UDP-N-acetylglucosamine:LPS N-acetylglucosamine transferase
MAGYRFIVSGPTPKDCPRLVSDTSISMPFRAQLASADVIVTKPGYSTIVEAVAVHTPIVYVRRYNFADESSLVEYVHCYGRAIELPAHDFAAGRWEHALDTVYRAPQPKESAPVPTGASEAADVLTTYLGN